MQKKKKKKKKKLTKNCLCSVCGLAASMGLGVGGNLPVDGALFLEYVPTASAGLLTLLSVWWPFGQLVGSLVGWAFLINYSCDSDAPACSAVSPGEACCTKASNMGWRYFMYTMGALTLFMWILRFFFFRLYESPKFLLSKGRQEEAVASVQGIAAANKTQTWLTVDVLNEVGGCPNLGSAGQHLSFREIVERNLSKFSVQRIAPLFHTKQLGWTSKHFRPPVEYDKTDVMQPYFFGFVGQRLVWDTHFSMPSSLNTSPNLLVDQPPIETTPSRRPWESQVP